ncbi:hypothetical protein LXA43DRAFT_1002508 [Ganoderma leucocontextum]|nr:hypothetical protein LXA43DRAFT_1002508 [Ganoderma leucocontextum]
MPTVGLLFSGRLRVVSASTCVHESRRTLWNPVRPRCVLADVIYELTKVSSRPRPGAIRIIPDGLGGGGVANPEGAEVGARQMAYVLSRIEWESQNRRGM